MTDYRTDPAASSGEPSAPPRRWWALAVLALGLALIILDGTVVGVSLPAIIADLGLDLTGAQWVTSLYSVVFAALLLTAGRIGDRVGRRRVFLLGLAVFAAGSALAGTAGGAGALIGARVVQGLGGACILPATLSTVNAVFRGRDRAAAFGVWGAVMSGAAAVGPLIGGALTEYAGWRWIFWVNVPLAALLVLGALAVVPDTRAPREAAADDSADPAGFALSATGFGLVVFGIIEGPTLGWWRQIAPLRVAGLDWPAGWPSAAPAALALGLAALAGFIAVERRRSGRGAAPLLELSMFREPTFTWGNLTACTVAIGQFALVFTLPLFLVSAVGLSTIGTGLVLAAMAAGAFASGAAARHLAARIGAAGTVVLGLALEVFGAVQLAAEERVGQQLWLVVLALVIYGVGLGLASAQLTSLVLADVPVEYSGQASATQSTVRQVGSAMGAALAGAVLSGALAWSTAGFTGAAAEAAAAVRASAGQALVAMRAAGADPALLEPLTRAFAEATRATLFAAAAALLIGLAGALRVRRAARGRG